MRQHHPLANPLCQKEDDRMRVQIDGHLSLKRRTQHRLELGRANRNNRRVACAFCGCFMNIGIVSNRSAPESFS